MLKTIYTSIKGTFVDACILLRESYLDYKHERRLNKLLRNAQTTDDRLMNLEQELEETEDLEEKNS